MTADEQITDEQVTRIMADLRDHQADVETLARALHEMRLCGSEKDGGYDGCFSARTARDRASVILRSDWLAAHDAAIGAQEAGQQLTPEELQNLAPGSTPVCSECTGNGLEVALNGRVTGDCRVCKGTGVES